MRENSLGNLKHISYLYCKNLQKNDLKGNICVCTIKKAVPLFLVHLQSEHLLLLIFVIHHEILQNKTHFSLFSIENFPPLPQFFLLVSIVDFIKKN